VLKDLVTLHLGQPAAGPSRDEPVILRRMLGDAFGTLSDVLMAGDAADHGETIVEIDRCRNELASGTDAGQLDPMARACLDASRKAALQTQAAAAEQRTQIAHLLDTVRETMAAVTGDQATMDQTLSGSADRFAQLAGINDLRQIQAQLRREVDTLKQITIERRTAWERRIREFEHRFAVLETQLDRTIREAAIDPLTNVANRRAFERTCRDWLAPNGPSFVMAMIDVDDFKVINDTHGHAVGDRVLVTVAETLTHSLRGDDIVARLGGDEFAVLAGTLTLAQAEARFTQIARTVQAACRPLLREDVASSISIGLAERSAGDTYESMQHRSDSALYHAKKTGKGRVAAKASPFIRDLRKAK
jgi:diguanylate cyclase